MCNGLSLGNIEEPETVLGNVRIWEGSLYLGFKVCSGVEFARLASYVHR